MHKILEDTNRKLSSVVSDLFGASGRPMLAALIAGERDPRQLATFALRTLRRKLPELELALTAQYTAHHGRLIQGALERIDLLERPITARDGYMGAWVAPLQPQIAQLDTIPGLHETAARAIGAESGTDRSRLGSAARLSAWAGVSPDTNESAGKRRRGKSRKGNRYLRRR